MSEIDDLAGPLEPPRDNGEIVFAAPWEQRVFGLAVALCRSQACDWEGFRQSLIRCIAEDPDAPYWQNWALALEDVIAESVSGAELDARYRQLLQCPAGHGHRRY